MQQELPLNGRREFIASPQQQDFFNWIDNSSGSGMLRAVAGAGKTETLARGVGRMNGYVTVMMFNKAAAVEFRERMERIYGEVRQGVRIGTCHSVGLYAWKRFDDGFNSDRDIHERKTEFVIEQMCLDEKTTPDQIGMLTEGTNYIRKMVSLGKQLLAGVKFDVHNLEIWLKIAAHYGVEGDLAEDMDVARLTQLMIEVFLRCGRLCKSNSERPGMIDFDDMIWAPLAFNAKFFQVDYVVGDEWQDTNPARRELAKRCLKRGGRFVGAGDDRQAIYGFTGADHDAMQLSIDEFKCKLLPLTVTYRCPKAVVRHAHTWVDHIEAHESAPEGVVRQVLLDPPPRKKGDAAARPWYLSDRPEATSAILCRYNKPLVQTAFALIKDGIACKMEGRDIGNGLIQLAKRWKIKTLDALEARLEVYRGKEIMKARAKRSETMEQSVNDRVDCLLVFVKRCRDKGANRVECLVEEIEALFADNVTGVLTLASGHKAKGREWNKVYWIQTGRRQGLQAHEERQEDNLCYVITTRAKSELILVPGEEKKA